MNLEFPLFVVISNWGEPYCVTNDINCADVICEDLDELEIPDMVGGVWDEESYVPISGSSVQVVNSPEELLFLIGESSCHIGQSLEDMGIYVL